MALRFGAWRKFYGRKDWSAPRDPLERGADRKKLPTDSTKTVPTTKLLKIRSLAPNVTWKILALTPAARDAGKSPRAQINMERSSDFCFGLMILFMGIALPLEHRFSSATGEQRIRSVFGLLSLIGNYFPPSGGKRRHEYGKRIKGEPNVSRTFVK
jgi:hypothetical protein